MEKPAKEQKKESIILGALKLFSNTGFYATTIPDIAKALDMSVGNMYNYFKSKDALAKEIIKYISVFLAKELRQINDENIAAKEKIYKIVKVYFDTAEKQPEMIEYFLRIYLSNREVFKDGCEGMICISDFVTEIMIFFEEGVRKGELRDQDFFSAFGLFMGYLGGMVFLHGENILPESLDTYVEGIADNIYQALKSYEN